MESEERDYKKFYSLFQKRILVRAPASSYPRLEPERELTLSSCELQI